MGKLRMGVCVRDIGGQKDIFSERERERYKDRKREGVREKE